MEINIRSARPEEAGQLAELMDMAGEGIPSYLWSRMAEPDEEPMEVGARRVRREDGGFSYRNAHVAEVDEEIGGLLVGYRLDDPYELGSLDDYPPVVRPLVELEAMAPGSWYVNAVAVSADHRRRGIGTMLMHHAEKLARQSGAHQMSLIVAEENRGAVDLYRKLGYQDSASRPVVGFPGFEHNGEWLLLVRKL